MAGPLTLYDRGKGAREGNAECELVIGRRASNALFFPHSVGIKGHESMALGIFHIEMRKR